MTTATATPVLNTLRKRLWLSASCGGAIWLVMVVLLLWNQWADALVLFGVLVTTPLALALAARLEADETLGQPWQVMGFLQPIAALCLVISYAVPNEYARAALAGPWLIVGFLAARMGLIHSLRRGIEPMWQWAVDVGLIYFLVGTIWLFASRAGHDMMGFGKEIVLLTAAHFHFAGLALPVLVSEAARQRIDGLTKPTIWSVLAGMPFVAIGITTTKTIPKLMIIETASAVFFSIACVFAAVLQLRAAWAMRARPTGWMLAVSSLCLLAGMGLATAYAVGALLEQRWLDIPTMVTTHATLNALGFSLLGLLAWTLERQLDEDSRLSLRESASLD